MHVLGIDAGGTKTVALLADADGHIVGEGRAGAANLQTEGELEVEKTLHTVIDQATDGRQSPAAVCLGIAGVDRQDDARIIRGIMRRLGFRANILIVNDALIALVAGAGANPGVVLISGTGSIAYGVSRRGLAARAGGWGPTLGDEGSGYWIGRRALVAVMREVDRRGPRTNLTPRVLQHFSLPRGLASDIMVHAADELTLAAESVITRLDMRGEPFPLLLAGGMLKESAWLASAVRQRMAEVAPRSQVGPLTQAPAMGAVRLAIAEAGGGARVPPYIHQ